MSTLLNTFDTQPAAEPDQVCGPTPSQQSSEIDVSAAQQFLNIIAGVAPITFQTFDDQKGRKDTKLIKVLHGSLSEHIAELTRLNKAGAGVFFMVNQGDGIQYEGSQSCRTKRNVIKINALFIDLDGAPLAPVMAAEGKPSVVVSTSPGRYHAYWKVDGCGIDECEPALKLLSSKFNSDPQVCARNSVLRVPGFYHQKGASFLVKVAFPEAF